MRFMIVVYWLVEVKKYWHKLNTIAGTNPLAMRTLINLDNILYIAASNLRSVGHNDDDEYKAKRDSWEFVVKDIQKYSRTCLTKEEAYTLLGEVKKVKVEEDVTKLACPDSLKDLFNAYIDYMASWNTQSGLLGSKGKGMDITKDTRLLVYEKIGVPMVFKNYHDVDWFLTNNYDEQTHELYLDQKTHRWKKSR